MDETGPGRRSYSSLAVVFNGTMGQWARKTETKEGSVSVPYPGIERDTHLKTHSRGHTQKDYAWTPRRYLRLVDVPLWRIQQHDSYKATPIQTQLYTPRPIPVVRTEAVSIKCK